MIEKLMHRYALSRQGAKDLIKGIVACTLQNISFMLPVTLLYLFVKGLLNKSVKSNTFFFAGGAIICLLVVFCVTVNPHSYLRCISMARFLLSLAYQLLCNLIVCHSGYSLY